MEVKVRLLTKSSNDKRDEKPGLAAIHSKNVVSSNECEEDSCNGSYRYGGTVAVEEIYITIVGHNSEVASGREASVTKSRKERSWEVVELDRPRGKYGFWLQ